MGSGLGRQIDQLYAFQDGGSFGATRPTDRPPIHTFTRPSVRFEVVFFCDTSLSLFFGMPKSKNVNICILNFISHFVLSNDNTPDFSRFKLGTNLAQTWLLDQPIGSQNNGLHYPVGGPQPTFGLFVPRRDEII